ncbi:MAG: efflux transporter outer membrane subunit [Acidobacteriaceae bacterium]|nr:efflux transporter outer membrane subunit [Acidobacteriaceae bacterium]MBV8569169.1 efflux transporter outer membrane subunit [Acidobacteriaceae bacterium]
MNRNPILALLLCAIWLASCTVGPKYTKPPVPAAPQYTEQPPASYQGAAGWKPAQPQDAVIRGNWWEIFHDPQLNSLEQQIEPANQTLKVAEANFRAARAAIKYNHSFLYPTLSAAPNISGNRISGNNPTSLGSFQYGNFVLPISVSYDADLWGRIRRNIAAAKEQYQASAADLENVKLELQTELAVDYFEARSLDAQRQLLEDTVVAYEKAYQLTRNRYEGGVASKVEVAQAQTQLEQTQAQEIDVGVARAEYQHAIAVLMGRPPEEFVLPPKPLSETPPVIPIGVPSQLLQRRPDIAAAERQVAAANEQIGIAKSAFFPDLVISATGGLSSGSIVDWFTWPSRYWSVGPQMLQTIFDAGRRRAQVESATAGYDSTVANYRQTALTAFQEVEDNLSTLRILEEESAKQHEATLSAENSLELSMNRYKGGLVTYLEVITAQSTALTNERTDVDLLRRRMDASVLLIKALGGGWDVSKLPHG